MGRQASRAKERSDARLTSDPTYADVPLLALDFSNASQRLESKIFYQGGRAGNLVPKVWGGQSSVLGLRMRCAGCVVFIFSRVTAASCSILERGSHRGGTVNQCPLFLVVILVRLSPPQYLRRGRCRNRELSGCTNRNTGRPTCAAGEKLPIQAE